MSDDKTQAETFKLVGGRLCLDFANTADWHASTHPHELITSYSDFVLWGRHADVLTDSQMQRLLHKAAQRPAEAIATLERVIALRETIYRIFSTLAHEQPPQAADLAALNTALSEALTRSRIASTAEGFAWNWTGSEDELVWPLWPVVRSAAELLTSQELHKVGQCADDRGCGWLFFDTSKNHSRRWCDIKGCGNRAKAQRYYQRKHGEITGALNAQVI